MARRKQAVGVALPDPAQITMPGVQPVSRRNTGARLCIANGQPLLVEGLDHFSGKGRPKLAQARIGRVEVGKDIAGPAHQLDVVGLIGHASISFSRLILSRTRSISWRGVEIPLVDFFWKA